MERVHHDSVLIGNTLYTWGGDRSDMPAVHDSDHKMKATSHIEIYHLHTGQWSTKPTSGKPPLGVVGYSCSAVNDNIYYFGGWCNHRMCYHNSLNELNTVIATWKELQPTSDHIPVMKRGYGGMITIEDDGVHCLLMIGGVGSLPFSQHLIHNKMPTIGLPNTQYDKLSGGLVRTNEHNMYNISTGEWATPTVIGECMPTCSGFTINNINKSKAIIFFGLTDTGTASSNVYVIDVTRNTVHWQCIKIYNALHQWPMERYNHASCIVNVSLPILVVIGGEHKNNKTFNDGLWILNINDCHWTKINVPDSVTKRWGHSVSSFMISSHCIWLVVVGGADSGKFITHPNTTMIVELVCNDSQWTVGCILDSTKLGTNDYQQKLMSTRALDEILVKIPKTKDAVTCLADIEYKWHEIGIALEVTHAKLEGLRQDCSSNTSKLSSVIGYWIEQSTDDPTWNELIEAIEGPVVASRSTAKNIRQFLMKPETLKRYGF